MESPAAVEHEPDHKRFVIRDQHGVSELVYNIVGSQIILDHTEVPRASEGQGYAGALARTALEYAREHHLSVIPVCPFVISYLSRHPEYQSLVKSGRFEKE